MKNALLILLVIATSSLTAQNIITWKGGTPGKENKWEEAKNWSGQHIPDEFSLVIIKQSNSGHQAQPVIDSEVTVASIEIHSGASLTITETGDLTIDGENTYSGGLLNYGGTLNNTGKITLKNITSKNKNYTIQLIDKQ